MPTYTTPVNGIDLDADPGNTTVQNPQLRAAVIFKLLGHLACTGATLPTAGTLGTNVTSVTPIAGGGDTAFLLSIVTSGATTANGSLCTVTFSAAFVTNNPKIVFSPMIDATRTGVPLGQFYADQTTTPLSTFLLKNTVSLGAGTFGLVVHVIG